MVSALVDGRNLAHELADRRPGFRQSAEWTAELAEALHHAHQQGIIHRDVKPSNVLVDGQGQVYLADFGLAKSNAALATLTIDGQMLGTPAYMAPEQASETNGPVDARTDVYSLGVVLYELLTGTRPFQGGERILLLRIQNEEPTSPRRLDDSVPRDLETICMKAMAKAPGDRYLDAASLADELRRYLRGEPVHARPLGPIRAFWRKCRRKPVVSGLAAALFLAVALGFSGVTWQWRRAEHQRTQAIEALSSGISTLSSALELGRRDPINVGLGRQREAFLDSLRKSLQDQSRTYPELNATLMSVTMDALKLLYQTAPPEEALRAHDKIRTACESLTHADPSDLSFRDALARCLIDEGTMLVRMGRMTEGEARVRESLGHRRRYLAQAVGRPGADSALRSAQEAWLTAEVELGWLERSLGRKPEAISSYRRAKVLGEDLLRGRSDSELAISRLVHVHWDLAQLVCEIRPSEAISSFRRAAELIEPIARMTSPESDDRGLLADSVYWLAVVEDRENLVAEARRDFRRAGDLYEQALRAKPRDPALLCSLSTCCHVLGRLHTDSGGLLESLEPYRRAIALREELCRLEPKSQRWQSDCAGSWYRLGEAMEILGRTSEAIDAYQKSLVHERRAYAQDQRDIKRGKALDEGLRHVFYLQLGLGRLAEAAMVARQRRALWPGDPAVAFSVSLEMAEAALVARPGESALARAMSHERHRYASEAFAAAWDAADLLRQAPRGSVARH